MPTRIPDWPRDSKFGIDACVELRGASFGSEEEILGMARTGDSSSEGAASQKVFKNNFEAI